MPYTVEILRRAEKTLRGLTDHKIYRRLREAIDSLAIEPRPHGCSKLSGGREEVRNGESRMKSARKSEAREQRPHIIEFEDGDPVRLK